MFSKRYSIMFLFGLFFSVFVGSLARAAPTDVRLDFTSPFTAGGNYGVYAVPLSVDNTVTIDGVYVKADDAVVPNATVSAKVWLGGSIIATGPVVSQNSTGWLLLPLSTPLTLTTGNTYKVGYKVESGPTSNFMQKSFASNQIINVDGVNFNFYNYMYHAGPCPTCTEPTVNGSLSPTFGVRVSGSSNISPTITLTTPTPQNLTDTSTFNIKGTASDADLADVVTVRYKIVKSDGTTVLPAFSNKFISSYVSNGITDYYNIPLTVNASDFANTSGTYYLKVWSEDQAGAKSPEQTVTLNLVLNTAPSVSLTTPDGSTVSAGSSIDIKGLSNDADIDDVVTLRYTIDYPSGAPVTAHENKFLKSFVSTGLDNFYSTLVPINAPDFPLQESGVYKLKVWAVDDTGAISAVQQINLTLNFNSTPTISLTTPSGASYTQGSNLLIEGLVDDPNIGDEVSLFYEITDTSNNPLPMHTNRFIRSFNSYGTSDYYGKDLTIDAEDFGYTSGTYYLKTWARDQNGAVSLKQQVTLILTFGSRPDLTLTTVDGQVVYEGVPYVIEGYASDPNNGETVKVYYTIADSGGVPLPAITNAGVKSFVSETSSTYFGKNHVISIADFNYAAGTYTLKVWAEDSTGLKSLVRTVTLILTTSDPPTLTLDTLSQSVVDGQKVIIEGLSNDVNVADTVSVYYSITESDNVTVLPTHSNVFINQYISDGLDDYYGKEITIDLADFTDPTGTHYLKVWAKDHNGVRSTVQTRTLTTSSSPANTAPIVALDSQANQNVGVGVTNGTVTLSGTVLDSDDDSVTIQATIGSVQKTTTVSNTSTSKPWALTWNTNTDSIPVGTYTNVIISAVDPTPNTGTVTYTGTITVTNNAPTITLTTTADQEINETGTATLSGTVSEPDGQDLTVSATIGGVPATVSVVGGNGTWTLTWSGATLPDGGYENILITAIDPDGASATATYAGKISRLDSTKTYISINLPDKQVLTTSSLLKMELTTSNSALLTGYEFYLNASSTPINDTTTVVVNGRPSDPIKGALTGTSATKLIYMPTSLGLSDGSSIRVRVYADVNNAVATKDLQIRLDESGIMTINDF